MEEVGVAWRGEGLRDRECAVEVRYIVGYIFAKHTENIENN